jgi:hypothetical protein
MNTKNTEYVKNKKNIVDQEANKDAACGLSENEQIEQFASILINIYLNLKDEEDNIEQE